MTTWPIWPPVQVEVHGSVAAMDPDIELLQAWRAGDKRAADALLLKYYDRVWRAVSTKLPAVAVDDLVQEVFHALVERRDTFRADAKFRAFLMTITRNKIVDYFRTGKRTADQILQSSVRDLGAGPSTLILQHENERLLLEALRSLELNDQFLLELYYWEDMSGPELAQSFEAPEPAIRSRLRRAKERLSAELQALTRERRELAATLTDLDAWALQLRESLKPYLKQLKQGTTRGR